MDAGAQVRQIRDLLECVWPAALETANYPFRSKTWPAALWVIVDRGGGDLVRTRRLGLARFESAVRRKIVKRGGQRPCLRIVRKLYTALADPTGVPAHRRGALERVQLLLEDWAETRGLGSVADQHRLRRPLPTPHHPRDQQAHRHPSPKRHRRGDPAAPARGDHHRPSLGPGHRRSRHPAQGGGHDRGLISRRCTKLTVGASPTRH